MKMRLFLLLFSLLLVLVAVPEAQAQGGFDKYVWEKPWVVQNDLPPNGEPVMCELQTEVQKLLETCCTGQVTPNHLGPFHTAPGFLAEDLYWLNPAETILVLAEALDYLPASQRSEVIRYLKFEMQSAEFNPLVYTVEYNVPSPLVAPDSYRSFYGPLPAELARGSLKLMGVAELAPPVENLYAAWAFAHHVSRYESASDTPPAWQIIDNNWANIEALYSQIPATPRTYWQIMGAIGYARMAKELGKPFAQAQQRALNGLNAGTNYVQFYRNMGSDEGCFGNGIETSTWDYCAFSSAAPVLSETQYNHADYAGAALTLRPSMFAAEIGRFLREQAQTPVMNHINEYMEPSGQWYFPFWWENKGTKPWEVSDANSGGGNKENAVMHPSLAWQLFMLRGTVGPGETGDSMRQFIDTPWAIADIFHMQKLVTVLRLYSTVQWAESEPGGSPGEIPFCADASFSPSGPLHYSKSASPSFANEGEIISYGLSIVRQGNPVTTTTFITDTLPVELEFLPDSLNASLPPAPTYTGGQVRWSGILSAVTQVTINYQMRVPNDLPVQAVNVATFYNPGLNSEPAVVTASVFLNAEEAYLPLIMK